MLTDTQTNETNKPYFDLDNSQKEVQHTSSQVRIPSKMVAKLIGERGKTITEICRDSKTKITIPRVQSQEEQTVILTITGTKMNIKTAQYIMQKLLKGTK